MAKVHETITEELVRDFTCRGCGNTDARGDRRRLGNGFGAAADLVLIEYAFISCRRCGLSEVYNLDILAEQRRPPGFFDHLLGNTKH